MLPYTPVHHLLLRQAARPLVMTSGNLTGEPIACEDDDAVRRLAGIADYFLTHNRPIHVRCDDSVTRVIFGRELILRRSRAYAPLPIRLSTPCAVPILACGGHLKNTFCLTRGKYAFLATTSAIWRTIKPIARSSKLSSISKGSSMSHRKPWPTIFIPTTSRANTPYPWGSCPVSPSSTIMRTSPAVWRRTAVKARSSAWPGTERVTGPTAGSGAVSSWWLTFAQFERLAHLEEVPLPGGEQAIRQPWRTAAACLQHVYDEAMEELDLPFMRRLDRRVWRVTRQMLAGGINSPLTSSAGRLFDAVAALVGLCDEVQYEAQAAIELEMAGRWDA